ncbi:MAG: NYN domain-containing protein, partial [Chloroflexus sp.]
NRNRDEALTVNSMIDAGDEDEEAADEPEYNPPQLDEPLPAIEELPALAELPAIEELPVPDALPAIEELLAPIELPAAEEPPAPVTPAEPAVSSEPPAKPSRSRRRSRKATAESETTPAEEEVTTEPVATEPVATEPVADGSAGHVDLTLEFSAEEWELFRNTVQALGKPATFQQLLSALQAARKQHSMPRTTEENRTMLKQAIHHGILERTTRNRRVYYTLKTSE